MSLSKTILGTIQGLNNEGSAKRIISIYFTVVLLTGLLFIMAKTMLIAAEAPKPTEVHVMIVKMFPSIIYSVQLTIWVLLGLATVETITTLVKTIRGGNVPVGEDKSKE